MRRFKMISVFVTISILIPSIVFAVGNKPRDYIPAPNGTTAAMIYYDHISGERKYLDGDLQSKEYNYTADIFMPRVAQYFQIGDFPAVFNTFLPIANQRVDGQGVGGEDYSSSQIGDLGMELGVWLYSNSDTKTYFALANYVFIPTGEYDNDKALNLGTNMWSLLHEIGFVQGFLQKFYFEVYGGIKWFPTENDEYRRYGVDTVDRDLDRDPIYSVESHLSYDVTKSFFISADYYYQYGGEGDVDGFGSLQDELNDHTIGFTAAFLTTPQTQLLLQFQKTIKSENGIENMDLALRWSYFF